MKVILLQRVPSLGAIGQVVEVSESYARNFLLPKKLAAPATSKVVADHQRSAQQKERKVVAEQARDLAILETLQSLHLELNLPASLNGKLFAALQERDIRAALAQQHQHVLSPSTKIFGLPLKHTGEHQLTITTSTGQTASLSIVVRGI